MKRLKRIVPHGLPCKRWVWLGVVFVFVGTRSQAADYFVHPAGSGGAFTTIQAAINAISGQTANNRANVLIAPGVYHETFEVDKPYVSLIGQGATPDAVKIVGGGQGLGTPAVYVKGQAIEFMSTNMTFENDLPDNVSQGLAMRCGADRAAFSNVRFLGYQDTLLVDNNSRQYFKNVFITGDTDFIFGNATAVFDHSTIQSTDGGYITAAATEPHTANGLVFLDSTLIKGTARTGSPPSAAGSGEVYLGRPWQWPDGKVPSTVFIRTKMDDHIRAEGWNDWGSPTPNEDSRYTEFGSMDLAGNLLMLDGGRTERVLGRALWSDGALTQTQADAYTLENLFGPVSFWNDHPEYQAEFTGPYTTHAGLPAWNPQAQLAKLPNALLGDFNDDGTVNAQDYAVWRESYGTGKYLANSPASPLSVDTADLQVWRDNFGRTLSQPSPAPTPEPSTPILLGFAFLLLAMHPVRRKALSSEVLLANFNSGHHGRWILGMVMLGSASIASAQIIAFPGAEGAGKFAAGGRNSGNVYVVTNLNDSGFGSLRHAVDTAPQAGRMIVFGVGGTINLQSDLRIDSPNITIAGQTAPAGGITLARRMLQVADTQNIILQHIAVRPGDYYTQHNTEGNSYEPDGIWVLNSTDVMIDHVSASWATDEVLSVTHGSTNVTVQWSLITEALNNSFHSKGEHGYGSIIHGGETTLHHNLYANNRSRNPATGNFNNSPPAHLDIVNNVISNTGDRFSYSGNNDEFEVNWVGNFGIVGPDTTRFGELFHPDNIDTLVYFEDNYYDSSPDGILQLSPASSRYLTGTSTQLSSPVVTSYQPQLVSAPTAYTQVLSYAGASAWRDPIDKRVIDDVVNQSGAIIDSQDEVGGYFEPTPVSQVLDPDGLPDWWKSANGFNPNDNSVGTQFAPDGYTYLEKYLHELSAPFLPPATTNAIAISTALGDGADGQVNESMNQSSGAGNQAELRTGWIASQQDEMTLLRFDLSSIQSGSIAEAELQLTAFRDLPNDLIRVYGLKHDLSGQDWDEASLQFSNSPGVAFDANSGTRDLVADDLLLLGEFSSQGVSEGEMVHFSSQDLAVFLNLLAYRSDESNTVTLLLQQQNSSSLYSGFASKEATMLANGTPGGAGSFAPQLVLQALLDESNVIPGDYNNDGQVDAQDYAVWREALANNTPLMYETASPGVVDHDDLVVWQENYGRTNSSSQPTPEPSSAILAAAALIASRAFPRVRTASSQHATNFPLAVTDNKHNPFGRD